MIRFVPMTTKEQWDWASSRANCCYCADTKGIIAVDDTGAIQAAVILDSWSENSVTSHIAIDNPLVLRHGFLEEVCNHVFNVCGRGVLIGITPSDNEAALRFNEKIGWVELYRIRDAYKVGVDYVVQEIRKETCKYLREDNGKEIRTVAA